MTRRSPARPAPAVSASRGAFQHAARWRRAPPRAGPARRCGTARRRTGSAAAKRQPGGRSQRARHLAFDRRQARLLDVEARDRAEQADRVRMLRRMRTGPATGACSTTRPAYITTTSSATSATTPRSWVMRMTAVPVSRCRVRMRSRICAWIVTSSAVVGSSAISRRGSQASAMAIIARWRMPPESLCGYSSKRCSGAGMRTLRSIARARSFASARPMRPMPQQAFDDLLADREGRVERGHRLLEDHRHGVAAQVLHVACRGTDQLAALEADRAAADAPGRIGHQAHDRERGHALAAARLADDGERLARLDREADAVDGREFAVVGAEMGAQIAQLEQRRHAGRVPRARWKRSMRASMSLRSVRPTPSWRPARQATKGWKRSRLTPVEAAQLEQRLGVVVDAEVELGMVLVAVDAQGRRLLAALVAAGRFARGHRRKQALGQRQRRALPVGAGGRFEHLGAGEHVAGDAEVVEQPVAARVDAARAGVRRRCAARRQHVQLAHGLAGVGAGQRRHDVGGAATFAEQGDAGRPVERIEQRLRRERADAAARVHAERADGEEAAGDRHAEASPRVARQDGPGHRISLFACRRRPRAGRLGGGA